MLDYGRIDSDEHISLRLLWRIFSQIFDCMVKTYL